MAKDRAQDLLGLFLSEGIQMHLAQRTFKDQPMEIRREVAGALDGGDDLRGAGSHEVQQHACAHGVHTPGVVHDENSVPASGFRPDQVGDRVQDSGRRTHCTGRQAGQKEAKASVGGLSAGYGVTQLKAMDFGAEGCHHRPCQA
ncbi:hypothetical protein D3C73_1193320 [compost metagenome]